MSDKETAAEIHQIVEDINASQAAADRSTTIVGSTEED